MTGIVSASKRFPRLYMPELDGLRFIAFLLVFLHHLPFPSEWLARSPLLSRIHAFGWIGVDIFLVLSAYLLTRLAIEERRHTGRFDVVRFYMRRALRIWPLYFLGLAIGFFFYPGLLIILGEQSFEHAYISIRDHFVPYSLFVGNFSYAEFSSSLGLYKSLWTVCMEEQFYLLFPILAVTLLIPCRPTPVLITASACILISLVVRIYFQVADVPYPWVWVTLLSRLDPFAFGIALAAMPEVRVSGLRTVGVVAAALGLVYLISSFPQLGNSGHTIWQLGLSALTSALLLLLARRTFVVKVLSLSPIALLGKISFGLYVYHRFTLDVFDRITDQFGIGGNTPFKWSAAAFLCLTSTVCVAAASYEFFEKRFLNTKRNFEIIATRKAGLMETTDVDQLEQSAAGRLT